MASTGEPVVMVPYNQLRYTEDGECVGRGWKPEGTIADDEVHYADGVYGDPNSNLWYESGLFGEYPACDEVYDEPLPPGATTNSPGTTPGLVAARHWERIPLPRPDPHIAPGWAITGKLAYLETNGQLTYTYVNPDTPFGELHIEATGRYHVDWGDGRTSGPHSMEGEPWPHGEITHEYTHVGTYDVVVTERWVATWSFAGHSGVLRELQTTEVIEDFEVRQIQAVIIG